MDKIKLMYNFAKDWATARIKERTSWDGTMLIAAGLTFLLFKGIATLAAWAAILYGAWTLWKAE